MAPRVLMGKLRGRGMVQHAVRASSRYLRLVSAVCLLPAAAWGAGESGGGKDSIQPQGLGYAGVYALREMEPKLTGAGVRLAVVCRSLTYLDGEPQNDYRPNIGHRCLSAGQFRFHDRGGAAPGISPHATAICSILAGQDNEAFAPDLGKFRYEGAAPKAVVEVHEFWHFLINCVFSQSPPKADVLSASIGSQFEDWWTRGIEAMAERYGLVVVAGIGNGSESYDPPLYPASGANVIAVGVVDAVKAGDAATSLSNFALAYPEHTSVGPTADGRCKPDVVAPGNCLAAMRGSDDYEMTGNWSSFATPIVAGVIGLLTQEAREDSSLSLAVSPAAGGCVMKAIVMNSATKLPYWHKGRLGSDDDQRVPLDYVQGAGMVNAVGAYRLLVAGRHKPGDVPQTGWDLNQIAGEPTATKVYRIAVAESSGKGITATLVWNRHYEIAYPFSRIEAKDADLRLEVWALKAGESGNDVLVDVSDSKVDNVEHIYCRAMNGCKEYAIVVSFGDSQGRSGAELSERYALAWDVGESQNSDSIFWHDLNGDGVVDNLDLAALLNNWIAGIKSPGSYQMGDVNADGAIDAGDLQVLLTHQSRITQ